MNVLRFKRFISIFTMLAFTSGTTLAPLGRAYAAANCDAGNPWTANGSNPACAVKTFNSGVKYAYPKLDWQPLADISTSPQSGVSLKMAEGNQVVVDNNRTAAALGLNASQIADVVSLFPTNVPFVFARWNGNSAELRIDIIKVEKLGTTVRMMRAAFGPAHGGAWAAAQTYSTASEKQQGTGPGRNPFAMFMSPDDDAFHNMRGEQGVQVAVGHAMRASGAPVGVVAVADMRIRQYTTTSGSFLRKKITQHVEGYAKPRWYIATPAAFQPHAPMYSMCMDNVANAADCPITSAVSSGVVWKQWTGGTLPVDEDMVAHWQKSKSSFTLIAWVAFAFVAFFTAGAALAAMGMTTSIVGPLTAIMETASSGALAGMGAAGLAAVEAGLVAVVGTVSGAGLTDGVRGPYEGADSAFGSPVTGSSDAERAVLGGLHSYWDTPNIEASGVRAVSAGAFGAGCSPYAAAAQCPGGGGIVPRVDTIVHSNTVDYWQDNGAPIPSYNFIKN